MLDFVVIGAAKSGTTSLWAYLRTHPEIWMPASKELPFFSVDSRYEAGYEEFCRTHLGDAPGDRLIGKATPQYMSQATQKVAVRIAQTLPDAKLIAILRDPVDRAYSAYRWAVLNGRRDGTVSFDHAATSEDRPQFVKQGEYGRILTAMGRHIPKDQVFIGFTEDLQRRPKRFVSAVFEFLGAEPTYVPPNLTTRYNRGGARERLTLATSKVLKQFLSNHVWVLEQPPTDDDRRRFDEWFSGWNEVNLSDEAREDMRGFLSENVWALDRAPSEADARGFDWYFKHIWNHEPDGSGAKMSAATRDLLYEHYRHDGELLQREFGIRVPWASGPVGFQRTGAAAGGATPAAPSRPS